MKTEYLVHVIEQDNGCKIYKWFYDDGSYREDGPSIEQFDKNGLKKSESWMTKGVLHRTDGPAFSLWKDGSLCSEYYYIHGKKRTKHSFLLETNPEYRLYIKLKAKFENEPV